jgi:hypothetical protein
VQLVIDGKLEQIHGYQTKDYIEAEAFTGSSRKN